MSALIPALIQLAMRGRGGGGGGGGGGGRGYGGSRGRQPFDAQAHLDKEAGKDQLGFDPEQDRSNAQMWDYIFRSYQGAGDVPETPYPNPYRQEE